MPTEDKNLTITKLSLDGGHVDALNKVSPGLGFALVRMFAALGNTQQAQSGHKGTVAVAKQTKKDNRGKIKPGLKLNDGRIAEVGDPEDDQDAVNLRTMRSALNCEQLAKLLEECADDLEVLDPVNNPDPESDPGTGEPGATNCAPIEFDKPKIVDTGMRNCHTVRAFNEYIYVCGFDDPEAKLQIYRLRADGKPVLLTFQVLSQECRRFVLQGHHIFGCKDGADSQMVLSLDVSNPWDPEEVDSLDVGFPAQGLYADANWLYVVGGEDDIAVVDVSDATALRKVN